MKRLAAFALMTLTWTSAHAQNVNPNIHLPSVQDFASRIDSQNYRKVLKGMHDGQLKWVHPAKQHMDFYAQSFVRSAIIRIADEYGIDPVTLVAAPLAENSMNTNVKRQIELKMAGHSDQLDDDGYPTEAAARAYAKYYLGHPLSIGPGQIYVSAAKAVEPLAAQIEHREIRKKGHDIKEALLTTEGSLRYAAAILRDAQDQYAAAGIDISRRPEILATLYNLGRVKEKAKNARYEMTHSKHGYNAEANYFGWFVALNYDEIRTGLNLPSVFDQPAK